MLRRFWAGRFAALTAAAVVAGQPVFEYPPFVASAFVGEPLGLVSGSLYAGSPGTITTDVVNAAGEVLPTSYVIQQGDKLRFRQIATHPDGVDIRFSGWAYGQRKITGYTDFTPVPCNLGISLTSSAQPGSRMHYASKTDGYEPALADFYFWTGSAICDSSGSLTGAGGVAYGSDWRNPSGPIKPYKHLTACLPTNNGLAPGVRAGSPQVGRSAYENAGTSRYGKPDRWLLKRGDTFDLDRDPSEYQVFVPGFSPLSGIFLSTPGGSDASNLRGFCDYGPSNLPRPRIIRPLNKGGAVQKANTAHSVTNGCASNVRWIGIHFDGQERDPDFTGVLQIGGWNAQAADKINAGFEDFRIDGMGIGDLTASDGQNQVYFYRGTLTNCWTTARNTGHISGMHSGASDPGRVQMVEVLIGRNGYIGVDPALVESGAYTPPAHNPANTYSINDIVLSGGEWYVAGGVTIPAGTPIADEAWVRVTDAGGRRAYGSVFDRNLYNAGRTDLYDCIVLRGGSGEQWRSGGFIRRNFIQAGYVQIADAYADSEDENQTALMDWNVIQNVNQTGVHTAQSIQIQLGCHLSLVERNLVTGAAEEANGMGLMLISRGASNDPDKTRIYNRTRNNVIRHNLLSAGSGYAVTLTDGLFTANAQDATFAAMPSLTGNIIKSNAVITSSPVAPTYFRGTVAPLAPEASDTVTDGNAAWPNRAAYASAKGGVDPTRTLKTYLQSLGHTVNSIDGVHEMVAIFNTMDRFNWPEQYTAKAINNYIRAGLGAPLQA